MVKKLRCSSLDNLFSCTPSVLESQDLRIEEDRMEATTGKGVHACMAQYIDTGEFDLAEQCKKQGIENTDDVADCMVKAIQVWNEIKKYFPEPMTERSIKSKPFTVGKEEYQIVGTTDVISPVGETDIIFNDWKSGWLTGCVQQMNGYAYAAWSVAGKPEDGTVTGIVSWLRHHYYRITKWNAADLEGWFHDLTHNVLPKTGTYTTGDHCRFCTLYHSCKARREVANGAIQVMMLPRACPKDDPYRQWIEKVQRTLSGLTEKNKDDPAVGAMFLELIWKLKLAMSATSDLDVLVRSTIERVGGIPLEDGRMIEIKKSNVRTLVPELAMPILRKVLPERAITDAMRLSLSTLLNSYAATVKTGKGKAKEALEADLNAASAIELTVRRTLEVKEKDKKELPE